MGYQRKNEKFTVRVAALLILVFPPICLLLFIFQSLQIAAKCILSRPLAAFNDSDRFLHMYLIHISWYIYKYLFMQGIYLGEEMPGHGYVYIQI